MICYNILRQVRITFILYTDDFYVLRDQPSKYTCLNSRLKRRLQRIDLSTYLRLMNGESPNLKANRLARQAPNTCIEVSALKTG